MKRKLLAILTAVCITATFTGGASVWAAQETGEVKDEVIVTMPTTSEPESGSVFLDGRPLHAYKGYCPVQMIWQHPEQAVNPRLRMKTVLEEGDQTEDDYIKKLGIEPDWLHRFPAELSGGELQRFCIARALGKSNRFLLADEISTMLDLVTQSQIWHFLIEETQRREIGMIIVSHSPDLVEKVCTRVLECG